MPSLSHLLSLVALTASVLLAGEAPTVSDSPAGAELTATFPLGGSSQVQGSVVFSALDDGQVQVSVNVSGLPTTGGPFTYHIHEAAVPQNGSCVATGGHFNPYGGVPCKNASSYAECEVGDLAGHWGAINSTSLETTYVDPYLLLNPDSKSSPYGLSVVIHYANTTRIACANLEETSGSLSNSLSNSLSSSVPLLQTSNGAVAAAGTAGALAAVLAGFVAMLL